MAGYWIRLQPELPQYTQYNVPLCSPCCLPSSHLQPGPFLPGGPQSRQKHTHKNNTQCHRGTQSHSPGRGETAPVHLAGRGVANMKLDKVEKQKARGHKRSLFTFFLLLLPAPSASLTISAHRWLKPFDVNAGQLHCCH